MYILKFQDEYGKTNYFSETLGENIAEFKSAEEAEKKAEELLGLEYDDFGSAITKYYVVKVEECIEKEIKSFRICDDGHECILSSTSESVGDITKAIEEAKKKYEIKIHNDKTYKNGSRVVKFEYEKKTKEDFDVVFIDDKDGFTAGYKADNAFEMSMVSRVLRDKYPNEITYYCNERENGFGLMTFKLVDKQKEFEADFLKATEVFFKVKVIKK